MFVGKHGYIKLFSKKDIKKRLHEGEMLCIHNLVIKYKQ